MSAPATPVATGHPAATPGRAHQEPPPANPPGALVGHSLGDYAMLDLAFLAGLVLGTLVGFSLGLYGYTEARRRAYVDYVAAHQRATDTGLFPEDTQ